MEPYPGTILIVDDRPENILPLKKILEHNQFQTDSALSGEDALRKVLKHNYSLIILDVQMPGMDGFEVAEAISGYSRMEDIPILFLSAVSRDKSFVTQGYASGGIDYLTKPVDPDILLLKVKTFHRLFEQKQQLKQAQESLKREIDERKKAQESLSKMNETLEEKVDIRTRELIEKNKELQRANEEMSQFTWVVSHDLREPLRKIETFSGMIRDRFLSGNHAASDLLDRTINSAARLSRLIEDLLFFTRLSPSDEFVSTDLTSLMNSVLSEFSDAIRQRSASIRFNTLPTVEVVPGQIQEAFRQLISNALKFGRQGRNIEIHIDGKCENEEDGCSSCVINITDNGIGFNTRYLDRIFVIFQRLNDTMSDGGTGLGLAVVKKVMENHNGSISAKSREGEGSTFTLRLPLAHKVKTI